MELKKEICSGIIGFRSIRIWILVVWAISFLSFLSLQAQDASVRNMKLDKSKTLTLAENGKADFVIVVSPEASKVTSFASKELKVFMDKALGANIPIVNQLPENTPAIIVGDCDLARKAGLDVKKLPGDGYYIKTAGNNIFILGKDDSTVDPDKNMSIDGWGQYYERATLFGVYEFIERFVGVRFYFPGDVGTVIPKLKELKLPAIDITDAPDFITRKFSWQSGKWFDDSTEKDVVKNKHLNNYRMRMETDFIPNCHGLTYLEYDTRFAKSNPEYFALLANGKRNNEKDPTVYHQGQLCLTGSIKEEIYKDAEAYLTGKPANCRNIKWWSANAVRKNYFNVMPQDGFVKCLCESCGKYEKESDIIWDMTCDIAEKLKKNNIPGYITQMAYGSAIRPPERKIPDNVLVMVAQTGPWNDVNDELRKKDDKILIDWTKKLGHKVWIWNYSINESIMTRGQYGLPGTVQMTPLATGKYYQRQAPYITGAYLESETDYFIMNYLNWYVFGKVCWDNKVDLNALLDEHYRLMFGAASGPMKKFYEALEEIWTRKIRGRSIETAIGPMMIKPNGFDLWEKYYSPERIAEFNNLFNEAERFAQNDADSLKRVKFMREHLLGPLMDASKKYFAEVNTLKTWIFPVKTLPATEKITIDGKLDDPAWKQSAKSFLLPFKSDKCEVKTNVYVLKDAENIYIGFDCTEPGTSRMKCPERKPDDGEIWLDSCVEIYLNPSGDRKNLFQMIVNASGNAFQISAVKAGAENSETKKWDSNAVIKTNIEKDRWTAEIAIPLKSLGKIKQDGFPINFIRTRGLTGEAPQVLHYSWSPFVKTGFNELENFGSLDFNPEETVPVINNGDFTAPQTGNTFGKWSINSKDANAGFSVTLDECTFIKGGKSLKLNSTGGRLIVEQTIALKPDTKYHIGFYFKMEEIKQTADHGGVWVQLWEGKQNFWFPKAGYTGTCSWTRQGFDFTTSSETKQGGLRLQIMNAKGIAWFDDVAITELEK